MQRWKREREIERDRQTDRKRERERVIERDREVDREGESIHQLLYFILSVPIISLPHSSVFLHLLTPVSLFGHMTRPGYHSATLLVPLQAVVNVARPFCFLEPGAPNEVLACCSRTRQKEKGKSCHWHRAHPFISHFTKKASGYS